MQTLGRMREVCQRRGREAHRRRGHRRRARGRERRPAFVRRVRQELDIPLRIIDAETEAALSYRSVAHHFRLAGERTLVADIGGGSLELIGAVDGLVELTVSLPLGAVRLTELHLPGERGDAQGDRAAPGLRAASSSSAASRAGRGPPPRSSAPAARSPAWAAWSRRGAGQPPGDTRPRRERHGRRGGAAHRLAGQPDAGAAPPGARTQPGAGRHHPGRTRGDGRAAGLGPVADADGERVRPARGPAAGDGRGQGDRARPIRCGCSASSPSAARATAGTSSRCATWPSSSSTSSARSWAASPRSGCCSRPRACCTTSASW